MLESLAKHTRQSGRGQVTVRWYINCGVNEGMYQVRWRAGETR